MYNKVHGTITMSHHVASKHSTTLKLYKTHCFKVATPFDIHQSAKKKKKPTISFIVHFFNTGILYKKTDHVQEQFFKELMLYITKGYYSLNSTKNICVRRLLFHLCK
jgi:hypothetical protein